MLTQDKAQVQAPQVWDKPTAKAQIGDYFHVPFTPVMQVVDKDIFKDGQVWLLVKPVSSSHTEEWVMEPEAPTKEQQQLEQEQKPDGLAGDSVSCQLQPTQAALAEYEQGRSHGQRDAAYPLPPMYCAPRDAYAAGYLEGYNSYISPSPQLLAIESPRWSIQYDRKWDWYRVWVGERCIGHALADESAERLARRYIATDQMIRRQNAVVMAAYSALDP